MFAAILISDFALQAVLRQAPDMHQRPVALVDPALLKPEIIQLTPAARVLGVAEGLTPSQAMARCAELLIKTRSSVCEQAATDILLQSAYAFSPHIEATAAGVCTMELKGLGLESNDAIRAWAEQIARVLKELHLIAQIGIALTPALALLAAHAAKSNRARGAEMELNDKPRPLVSGSPVLIVCDSTTFVSALPIAALDPEPELSSLLKRWGIHTIGALLGLGKSNLAERLGPSVIELLNRVSVSASRPLKLVSPKQTFEEEIEFETEIETAEPLLFVLRRFVEQLTKRLDVIHLVVSEIHLQLKLSSGAVYEQVFKIPAATGNFETLFRMLQTHLETMRTDSPIVALRLEARPCPPGAHQFGLFETTLKDPNQFAETLARLTALVGPERVGTPIREATHRPDAFRLKAPEF